jgi:hypothetical protein
MMTTESAAVNSVAGGQADLELANLALHHHRLFLSCTFVHTKRLSQNITNVRSNNNQNCSGLIIGRRLLSNSPSAWTPLLPIVS